MEYFLTLLGQPEIQNAILALFGLVLTVIINRVASAFTLATGINIEASHREALHQAIRSGVESAVKHGAGEGLETLKVHVVQHVRESVPDALRQLRPGDGVINRLIERYTLEALSRFGGPK